MFAGTVDMDVIDFLQWKFTIGNIPNKNPSIAKFVLRALHHRVT